MLDYDSVANVQGLGTIPIARLERKPGKLPDQSLMEIKQALLFVLDLEVDLPQVRSS
jgi:mRNA interferase MazF